MHYVYNCKIPRKFCFELNWPCVIVPIESLTLQKKDNKFVPKTVQRSLEN